MDARHTIDTQAILACSLSGRKKEDRQTDKEIHQKEHLISERIQQFSHLAIDVRPERYSLALDILLKKQSKMNKQTTDNYMYIITAFTSCSHYYV